MFENMQIFKGRYLFIYESTRRPLTYAPYSVTPHYGSNTGMDCSLTPRSFQQESSQFSAAPCPAQRSEPCLQCNSLSRGVLHVWGNCCLVMWAAAAAVKCDDSRRILAAAPCSSLDSSRLFRDHHPGPSAYGGTPGNRQRAEEWGDHYRSPLWLTFWWWWGLIIYRAYFRDTGFTFFPQSVPCNSEKLSFLSLSSLT